LMKNSRKSDRELAQAIGVSQPTVSRLIARLRKQGVIKEFTMIPDLTQLGFKIMAVIFLKLERNDRPLSPKQLEEMFSTAHKLEKDNPRPLAGNPNKNAFKGLIRFSLNHDADARAPSLSRLRVGLGWVGGKVLFSHTHANNSRFDSFP